MPFCDDSDRWDITEDDRFMSFYVSMNNFDLSEFARRIGVPEKNIVEDEQN